MDLLLETNRRYPHAWYARRFFNKVTVSEEPGPHFGMGLDSYVQWTSPIRRLTDLQVIFFSVAHLVVYRESLNASDAAPLLHETGPFGIETIPTQKTGQRIAT